ncbi:MAG: NTP transferase domain-containing protein, partial [Planctomycetes bacterium]|nr:NTP transferase domain-containing protein [Planctomycetota bacterium]
MLAGGRGERLGGRDKSFLTLGGTTLLDRTLLLFRSLFEEVVVVARRKHGLGAAGTTLAWQGECRRSEGGG